MRVTLNDGRQMTGQVRACFPPAQELELDVALTALTRCSPLTST